MDTMTRSEIHKKVGEEWALADDIVLSSQLIYISGITGFDTYLDGKDQKEINSIIRIKGKPRGIVFKLTKNISSKATAITYNDIENITIIRYERYVILKVITTTTPIYFGSDTTSVYEVIDFLRSLKQIEIIEHTKIEVPQEIKEKLETFLIKHTDLLPINTKSIKASKAKRCIHFVIDSIVIAVAYTFFFKNTENLYTASIIFQGLLLHFLYYFILEYTFKTTIGKLYTGTKVVSQNGTVTHNLFFRTLYRLIPFEPFSFLFGRQGWHDQFSKTIVIDKRLRKEQIASFKK